MPRLPALILLALLTMLAAAHTNAGQPEFSYMTLHGMTKLTVAAEDIPPEIVALGLTPAKVEQHARERLSAAGLAVVSPQEAMTAPTAGKLRIRLLTNRDGYGLYYYGMKLELRQKIMLGNAAGGFVSQVVWTDGESGTMQANEFGKPLAALDRMLAALLEEHRVQNAGGP